MIHTQGAWLEVERMMRMYGDSILRLCCLMLADPILAQDATQETFIKAYFGLAQCKRGASELEALYAKTGMQPLNGK